MDPAVKLRQEFLAREKAAMRGGTLREAGKGVSGMLGGAGAMIVAIAVTVVVTRLDFYWHSFLLEMMLAGVVGYLLQRTGGGLLKGVVLLPASYGAAFTLRRMGWDPATWLAPEGSAVLISGHGHLLAVCCLVGCGGLLGYVVESRR